MTIQKIPSSVNAVNPLTYVGSPNTLWYDRTSKTIRVSDGVTPGGLPLGDSIVLGNPIRAAFNAIAPIFSSSTDDVTACKLTIRMQIGMPSISIQTVDVSAVRDSEGRVSYTISDAINSNSSVPQVTVTAGVSPDNRIEVIADTHDQFVYFTYSVVEFADTI